MNSHFLTIMVFAGLSAVVHLSALIDLAVAGGIETLLVIEPSKQYPRHSEGDVIELSDGRLCLVYTRFTGGGADHAAADIVARTSADDGGSWSDDRILVKNEGRNNVMSVSIVRVGKDGNLLLFYLRKDGQKDCHLYVRRSSDEFKTLSDPVRVTVEAGYHVVNNDRVIHLAGGRLIAPAAVHYSPRFGNNNYTPQGVPRTFLSDDGGMTWRAELAELPREPAGKVLLQEPGVLEVGDGRVWMWLRTDAGVQYECFSEDGGERWSPPKPGGLASPLSPATIERVPWTGDLLCVWNDHSGWHAFPKGKRTPLCLAISKDLGRTWSPSRVIDGDPDGWYCYTSMTFVGDRVILSYCAGDTDVGGLNRLKVAAISRGWLYPKG